jgi:AcrR family transcriptional regulator
MSTASRSRRRYESPRRREQAATTRRAILDAARAAFLRRGYVATTIDAIAAGALVSPETVYATFRSKRAILAALVDVSIAGDDEPVRILERSWVDELHQEPDRRRRVALLAAHGRAILERRSAIDAVVMEAAAADPEMAVLLESGRADRLAGQRELLAIVAGPAGFHQRLSPETAADLLYAIGSPEVWRLLVVDRGWTPEQFETWYASAVEGLLADDPAVA